MLGVISPHPPAMPGAPSTKKLASKCKKGLHSTRQPIGPEGPQGQEGDEGCLPTPLSQPRTAGVEWAAVLQSPSYAWDQETELG